MSKLPLRRQLETIQAFVILINSGFLQEPTLLDKSWIDFCKSQDFTAAQPEDVMKELLKSDYYDVDVELSDNDRITLATSHLQALGFEKQKNMWVHHGLQIACSIHKTKIHEESKKKP